MIIDKITIHNFGVYGGRHDVALTPTDPTRPIILFGGLNGGGKTTFLDALLLVLYGKFAKCSNRGNMSYDSYLRNCINRGSSARDGAGIELEFRHRQSGVEESVRICRSWRASGKGIREDVTVYRNDQVDPECTDRWYEFVEELIPSRIANLFFFDGEKIEDLATSEQASSLLRTGIHALLGLDLIETLENDLKVVERRRKAQLGTTEEQHGLTKLTTELEELGKRRGEVTQKIGSCKNRLDSLDKARRKLEQSYKDQGGDLYDQRVEIMTAHERTSREMFVLQDRMRDVAAGDAPFLLIKDKLESALSRCERDKEIVSTAGAIRVLKDRDAKLLARLRRSDLSVDTIESISSFLKEDLSAREECAREEPIIDIEPESIRLLLSGPLDSARDQIVTLLNHAEKLEDDLGVLEKRLESIPDPEGLEGISEALANNEKQTLIHEHKLNELGEDLGRLSSLADRKQAEIDKLLESNVRKKFSTEKSRRVIGQSASCRHLLSEYRERVCRLHIQRLEQMILESFHLLMRKKSLVASLTIDANTYVLRLFTQDRSEISLNRLSAGERQLLATAILWGLSKASGRSLPMVIDTPLGRLDGTHRENLVEAYFPLASHQVILLSTDQEIDKHHYEKLTDFIDREYSLRYDDGSDSSEVIDGYFWKGAA